MSLRLAPSFVGTWLSWAAACANSDVVWQDSNLPPSTAGTNTAGDEGSGAASSSAGGKVQDSAGTGGSGATPAPGDSASGAGASARGGTETGGSLGVGGAAEGDAGSTAGAPEEAEVCPPECCALPALDADDQPSAASPLADSRQGFSSTQGRCGWSYGYFPSGTEPFTLLSQFVASPAPVWRGSTSEPPWSAIYREKQHPNQVPLQWIARRWTSPVQGLLTVKGHVAKADSGGDGVLAQVRADGLTIWEQRVDDSAARDFEVRASAVVGTVIDLIVAPRSGDAHDATEFTAFISR
jgi:hypothetical protein